MPAAFQIGEALPGLVDRIVQSYESDDRTRHTDKTYLPSRAEVVEIIHMLLELAYPGYFGRQNLTRHNVKYHVGELLPKLGERLFRQIDHALCYKEEVDGRTRPEKKPCDAKARRITMEFLERIPAIRARLAGDVQAAYDGDPAAINTDEVILAYPGVLAVTVYRFAHELHMLGVPLIPRMMTEWAHTATGTDIHPGASIGPNFFIDHASGVVIGETTDIGENVKLYQGVTLGALSFPKDERGRIIRGHKRHPTVQAGVTIYANATVLGGETVLGDSSIIGGSVFLTNSIPPNATVSMKPPELKVRKRGEKDDQYPFGVYGEGI
ncbi:MAG: serine acetyltransferase [Phycisphaerae bacterium]|nr:serine acetyltransferase [Phycisphaerae bacterium]